MSGWFWVYCYQQPNQWGYCFTDSKYPYPDLTELFTEIDCDPICASTFIDEGNAAISMGLMAGDQALVATEEPRTALLQPRKSAALRSRPGPGRQP